MLISWAIKPFESVCSEMISKLEKFLLKSRNPKHLNNINPINTLTMSKKHYNNKKNKRYVEKQEVQEVQEVLKVNENQENLGVFGPSFVPLCCKQAFCYGEPIEEPEGRTRSYLQSIPSNKADWKELVRHVCSMLNDQGGIILVGVEKPINGQPTIRGQIVRAYKIQQILMRVERQMKNIQPDILTSYKCHPKVVPVFNHLGQYIKGCYVIRIVVEAGLRNHCYWIADEYNSERGKIVIRVWNRPYTLTFAEVMERTGSISLNPLPEVEPVHEGPCFLPSHGSMLWQQLENETSSTTTEYQGVRKSNPRRYKEKHTKDSQDQINPNNKS